MIEVSNLTKYYGKRLAVDNLSFSVEKGEIVGFLGPNAAGKTTTMRIITGYLGPTKGTVKIAGYDVLTNSLEARRHIGYLPESVPLYADMGVRDYLTYMASLRAIPRDKLKNRVDGVIERCHLGEYVDMYIGKLSKGYRQRVGIAQAIVHEPEVLILDEPTIGIDPIQIASTRQLIRELGKDRTVLISTHILPEVSVLCGRAIIIDHGKVVAQDKIENLSAVVAGSKRIRLEVEGPTRKIADTLRQIKGVTRVSFEESRFVVEFPSSQDLRAKITESVVKGGFTLLSSESVEMSLEDVFLKLTTKEEDSENEEKAQ
jgi:ABC-2 type transport system ATP-binding protein